MRVFSKIIFYKKNFPVMSGPRQRKDRAGGIAK